jgi:hypothetical protein
MFLKILKLCDAFILVHEDGIFFAELFTDFEHTGDSIEGGQALSHLAWLVYLLFAFHFLPITLGYIVVHPHRRHRHI